MQLSSDFSDLISALSAARARFLIVGAYAVMHHAEPRYTKDLDIWVEPTTTNARRVLAALRAFGAPMAQIAEDDFSAPGIVFQIGVEPVRIDLLTSIAGLKFGPAYKNAVAAKYGDIPVKILSLDDILTAKRAAGRPQDLLDAARLEEARAVNSATNVHLPAEPCKVGALLIATVSWPWISEGAVSPDQFLSALRKIKRRCDLVLCAGMRVNNHPMPRDILEASSSSPVVFEREDGCWCVVYNRDGDARRTIVRARQTVVERKQFTCEEPYRKGGALLPKLRGDNPVARSLSDGEGFIHLERADVWFALLICGENNALQFGAGPSVFRDKPRDVTLPVELGQPWILLNPAHAPYRGGSRGGRAKVDSARAGGAMLENLVRSGIRYTDKTVPPAGVVHCNNVLNAEGSDQDGTRTFASVVFWDDRRRLSRHEYADAEAFVVVYDLPLKNLMAAKR